MVKSATPYEKCMQNGHLLYLGLEPVRTNLIHDFTAKSFSTKLPCSIKNVYYVKFAISVNFNIFNFICKVFKLFNVCYTVNSLKV